MEAISLNPDFDRLNKYFPYWLLKEDVPNISWGINYKPGWVFPSYESYLNMQKEELTKKAQNVFLDIDLMAYLNLLEKNNLQDFHDDILFVVTQFKEDIPIYLKSLELSGSRNPLIKYYQILKFLKVLSRDFDDGMELIVMVKNKKIKESISIDNSAIINKVLKTIESLTYNRMLHFIEYEKPDSEDLTYPTLNDLSLEYIESKLRSHRPKKGRQRGINHYTANFLRNLLSYLNHETPLTSEPKTRISNRQALFLFDLMSLIGLFDYDRLKILYPEDYIRAILSNFSKALMSSFSSK